ncbi:hypothetical protein [Paraburkholderia aspalathi]|uniref:hypothetical protein n=1 Tax=Paraburkholderia aspalathi TaxID=1324617 RepID=UPI0038BC8300
MSSPHFPVGAHGTLHLLTETDPASGRTRRDVHLEAAPDGRSVLLVDIDARRPGIHRAVRYEITPAELVAVIRRHGELIVKASDARSHSHQRPAESRHGGGAALSRVAP